MPTRRNIDRPSANASRRPSTAKAAAPRPTQQSAQQIPSVRTNTTSQRRQSGPTPRVRPSTATRPSPNFTLILVVAIVAIAALFLVVQACSALGNIMSQPPKPKAARVSLVAVGDNLTEQTIGAFADAASGEVGDGSYDYRPLYTAVKSYIENADVAYINQEVHMGSDELGPRGYPSFNVTSEMADCIVDLGFDFVASATNHSYDWGPDALENSVNIFKTKPVAYTGTANSPEDAAKIATVERDGITFALLNYTYGVNGYDQSEIPEYAINFYSEDRLVRDVASAKEVADVVLVAMHWGTELSTEANDEQRHYAQLLADAGVDMIIGSHPHCIEPMEWYEGVNGNKMLCVYSLGNFISAHENPGILPALEGMVSCDFVRARDSEDITIENVIWTPLISHRDEEGGEMHFGVYPLKDYTDEMARKSIDGQSQEDPLAWYRGKTTEVIGSDFTINM